MTNENISRIAELTQLNKVNLPPYLYHYTNEVNVNKIIRDDYIWIKLTHIKDFKDKLEGRIISQYYNSAIDELVRDDTISTGDASTLRGLFHYKKPLFIERHLLDDGKELQRALFCVRYVYVFCLSADGDSNYMKKKYTKGESKNGACIEFSGTRLNSIFRKNDDQSRYDFFKIIYGNDIKTYLTYFLERIIECTGGVDTEDFKKFAPEIINRELTKLEISTKEEKYRQENEIRFVFSKPIDSDYFPKCIINKGEFVIMDKRVLCGKTVFYRY